MFLNSNHLTHFNTKGKQNWMSYCGYRIFYSVFSFSFTPYMVIAVCSIMDFTFSISPDFVNGTPAAIFTPITAVRAASVHR